MTPELKKDLKKDINDLKNFLERVIRASLGNLDSHDTENTAVMALRGNLDLAIDALNTEEEFEKFQKDIESKFDDEFEENLSKQVGKILINEINSFFGKKTATEETMFKTIKEAKAFTAHLDALANEIESLNDVSPEMKKHLAYRLDKLSDLIEGTSKEASVDKEANGLGDGAWAYDKDEERYMKTMGGTGSLEGDKDEAHYMSQFKGDDHQEVLNRKEPKEIAGGSAKVKQPSDDYKEAPVANKIRSMVEKIIKKQQA